MPKIETSSYPMANHHAIWGAHPLFSQERMAQFSTRLQGSSSSITSIHPLRRAEWHWPQSTNGSTHPRIQRCKCLINPRPPTAKSPFPGWNTSFFYGLQKGWITLRWIVSVYFEYIDRTFGPRKNPSSLVRPGASRVVISFQSKFFSSLKVGYSSETGRRSWMAGSDFHGVFVGVISWACDRMGQDGMTFCWTSVHVFYGDV